MSALVERTALVHPRHPLQSGRFTALVAVADPALRTAVARTLRVLGAREVSEAGSSAEARTRAVTAGPDLLVTEAALPDGSGVMLAGDLRARGVRGVVITASDDPYSVRAALAAGVRAYLVAGASPASRPAPERQHGVDQLSAREVQVLRGVADGRSNKDVGEQLGLSALTVKSHLARIARKLGTGDRAEMVAIGMRAGVLE